MTKIIAGGCSFTFGHELSDDIDGKTPSKNTWAYGLAQTKAQYGEPEYVCAARSGLGNDAIARRTFRAISQNPDVRGVVVMWSFTSRYDWAMPRHRFLEDKRWTSISPWDTEVGDAEAMKTMQGSETQQEQWKTRQNNMEESGVKPFAEAIYKYAANQYHEIYLSWKSIIWLQNLMEKKNIPFMFTLADNSLFFQDHTHHRETDPFFDELFREIDISKWFTFGERMMGFNQWAMINGYPRGTTHPLDESHKDAVKLMMSTFNRLIGGE